MNVVKFKIEKKNNHTYTFETFIGRTIKIKSFGKVHLFEKHLLQTIKHFMEMKTCLKYLQRNA